MLRVHEIFTSIQGEGYDSGIPCTFIRLFGCNVSCAYCDQPQKKEDCKKMDVNSIISTVRSLRIHNVCITGGEPLIQPEVYSLIYELVALNYKVSIETNGCVPIDDMEKRQFKYVMDVKCPSSGVCHFNCYRNLLNLHTQDEVKFVIADREDYDFMKKILRQYPTRAKVLLSPMFTNNTQSIGKELSEWVIKDRLDVKIQIQLHKVLNVQ